ncbi:hypothetical protein FHR81_001272 [Actinoalloteichus hoggarensis]|uniref:Uncharacterized protein n=1 Tax=Actinoalloteichus hoggarensis TaxID=1470176 RepID=A0A221VZS7_9PSEU|nr:hypothetical protein [Actinoalloteichus hoggarensis]ASO19006.1 hypothetical protein AHOG_06790 [Actinoalloteichus hoggarensis]MBB5920242.1 hypothetical protein [Actinoalloteichus hoggarensis]
MTDQESVKDALADAAGEITPSPAFTDRVMAGGRRRRRAGRLLAAATTVVALSTAGLLPTLLRNTDGTDLGPADSPHSGVNPGENHPARHWLAAPTRGDLRDDQAFLDEVIEAWGQDLPYPEHSVPAGEGEPNVVVASDTASGPVAVVVQDFWWEDGYEVLSGVLATSDDGGLEVLRTNPEYGDPLALLLGPDRPTLLAVSPTDPLYVSVEFAIDEHSGIPEPRDWDELPLTEGLALTELQPDLQPADLLLSTHPGGDGHPPPQFVIRPWLAVDGDAPHHEGWDSPPAGGRLQQGWAPESGPQGLTLRVDAEGDTVSENGMDVMHAFDEALHEAGAIAPDYSPRPLTLFALDVNLPDGRRAYVGELMHNSERAHLYATIRDQDRVVEIVHAGRTPTDSPLPVRVRMPDDQGWAVFSYQAELRYRDSPESPWRDVHTEWGAALLPDTAVQVEVTDAEGRVAVVELAD